MEGVTETKFGAKTKGWTIQRLPYLGVHYIISHQTQTQLHHRNFMGGCLEKTLVEKNTTPGSG